MKYLVVVFVCVFCFAIQAYAEVRITEIAWMGNGKSQYGEWFELYNDGESAVNLAGWKLYEAGSTLSFAFSKSIPTKSYFLVERTTPSTPDPIPGISDEGGSFGGSGFANTGEDLVLKDAGGTIVQSLNFAGGWPGGDAKNYKTMQWNGSKWITATATPKSASPADGDEGEVVTDPDNEDEDIESDEEEFKNESDDPVIPLVSPNDPYIEFVFPSLVVRGVPYDFASNVVLEYSYHVNNGSFYWNMGDGTVVTHSQQLPVRHVYEHPGTYTVSMAYYEDPSDISPILTARKKVQVFVPSISIAQVSTNAFSIKNDTDKPLDLSGWSIATPTMRTLIPNMTVIAEKASIVIPYKVVTVGTPPYVRLLDPTGVTVATTEKESAGSIQPQVRTARATAPEASMLSEKLEKVQNNNVVAEEIVTTEKPATKNRTRVFVIGAVIMLVIGLCVLLERFMVRQE